MSNPSEDKQNWREKYLDALDTQEALEQKFSAQLEQLRRALIRVSVAADGQDEALDQIMQQMRDQLRGGKKIAEAKPQDVEQLLARLDLAAVNFEQWRDQGAQDVREALSGLVKSLQAFNPPRAVKKEIDQYLSQLPQRCKKVRLYPALLQQLASIQTQALANIERPQQSLFGRLFGRAPAAKAAVVDASLADAREQDDLETQDIFVDKDTAQALNPALDLPKNSNSPASVSSNNFNDANKLQAESAASDDADWVHDLLHVVEAFLASLEQDDSARAEAGRIRTRLLEGVAKGVVSDKAKIEIVGSLTHIRHLVMDTYLIANHAFATYLDNVNRELAEIYSHLGGAAKTHHEQRSATDKLQADVMREIQDLEQHTNSATDLSQLKNQVKSQIGNIRDVLAKYQESEQAKQVLAQQLNSLGEKIKDMEVEAEKSREILAVQRHKALHDPLTELPNREAYKERAQVEVQRWERYARPLTIAVIDIDHFKKINDTYGHQAGDRVLKVIGRSIAKRLREVDFFCRFGGEEFVALLPETSGETALQLLDKIREAIASAAFNYKEQPLSVRVSVGLSEFTKGDTLESAFERADQALYSAKADGRNACRLV